ncbi:MAG: FAD-binding oxidoreductase [Leptolyngbyaceae cyanobacterium SL_7_1]|nr:FAD-binding oxidoreductase [Leptolyngbyaceae cyanobacterium SL_7_1]
MQSYDWIVIGGGLGGAALSYELAKVGFAVLLVEQNQTPDNATRFSYGGISFWSGTTPLLQQLGQEGIDLHRTLTEELGEPTHFRELDLILTIDPDRDPQTIAESYNACLHPPTLISAETAAEMEPLLAKPAIAAALHCKHGHVDPEQTIHAYTQAFLRLGGAIEWAKVTDFCWQGSRVEGVIASGTLFTGANVVVCAGGMSRALLRSSGLTIPLYFTQAELIETPSVEVKLHSIVMPAELKRFQMEADAAQPDKVPIWDQPDRAVTVPILDVGAVQLVDGRLRIGQISRTLTTPTATGERETSAAQMRHAIARYLPALEPLPGTWHSCLVGFSGDRLPVIGAIPHTQGIHVFSGFSNPFAILPPLARHVARQAAGQPSPMLDQLAIDRFVGTGTNG